MTLFAQTLDHQEVSAYLASELQCTRSLSALRTAVIAEHVRTLIWAPYLREAEPVPKPVHTARLFAALDRNVRCLTAGPPVAEGSVSHEGYQFVCEQLERCGDIVRIGNGYWIPCPVRVIGTAASLTAMVVGGVPTNALPWSSKVPLHAIGPGRYLPHGSPDSIPQESVADWLGMQEPLASWTGTLLSWAATQLQPQAEIQDDAIEIYAPDLFREHRSPGFWMGAKDFREAAPILRLFRPRVGPQWTFARPEYLGIFKSELGGARLTRAVRIPREAAYRLQFGFDQRLRVPRTVHARQTKGAHRLELPFALPSPENRVLGLAWHERGDEEYFFDELALPVLNEVLAALGVALVTS